MAIYSGNRPNRTLTLHKSSECSSVPKEGLKPCGCGETGQLGNQEWWCETHVNIKEVNRLMNNRFWAILLCEKCYQSDKN